MRFLDVVADCVNPALTIAAIVAAVLEWREKHDALRYLVATALSVAAIYAVMFIDRRFPIWERFGGDYSTHTAFATALVVSMCIRRARWRVALISVWLAYVALILIVGYHGLADVVTAAMAAVLITLPWHLALR